MRMQRCTLKSIFRKQSPARAHVSPLERSCNKGTRSSVNFPARAYCKSTGWAKSPLDARSSVRHDSARAPNPPLERTVRQCREMLDARILRSSAKFPARAGVRNLGIPDCTSKLKPRLKCNKTDPLGLIFWKTFINT